MHCCRQACTHPAASKKMKRTRSLHTRKPWCPPLSRNYAPMYVTLAHDAPPGQTNGAEHITRTSPGGNTIGQPTLLASKLYGRGSGQLPHELRQERVSMSLAPGAGETFDQLVTRSFSGCGACGVRSYAVLSRTVSSPSRMAACPSALGGTRGLCFVHSQNESRFLSDSARAPSLEKLRC